MYYAKEVFNMQKAQTKKVWKRFQVDMLKNKEMLVVGYGDIGRSIGKRAKALGMVVNGVRSKKVIEREIGRWFRRCSLCKTWRGRWKRRITWR